MYRPGGALGDTAIVLLADRWPADMQPTPRVYWDSVPSLVYGRDGSFLGSIGPDAGMEMYGTPERTGSLEFGRISASAHGGDRLYYTDNATYEIQVWDGAPSLRRIMQRAGQPPPVDAEAYFGRLEEAVTETPPEHRGQAERLLRERREREMAEREPAWGYAMAVADNGSVWIERYAHRMDGDVPPWDVFDPHGRWLGTVRPPVDFRIHAITGDEVLAVWEDELDVEYVGVWELQWPE